MLRKASELSAGWSGPPTKHLIQNILNFGSSASAKGVNTNVYCETDAMLNAHGQII